MKSFNMQRERYIYKEFTSLIKQLKRINRYLSNPRSLKPSSEGGYDKVNYFINESNAILHAAKELNTTLNNHKTSELTKEHIKRKLQGFILKKYENFLRTYLVNSSSIDMKKICEITNRYIDDLTQVILDYYARLEQLLLEKSREIDDLIEKSEDLLSNLPEENARYNKYLQKSEIYIWDNLTQKHNVLERRVKFEDFKKQLLTDLDSDSTHMPSEDSFCDNVEAFGTFLKFKTEVEDFNKDIEVEIDICNLNLTDLFNQISDLIKDRISGEEGIENIKDLILERMRQQKNKKQFLEELIKEIKDNYQLAQENTKAFKTLIIDSIIRNCSEESPINSLSQENQASSSSYNPELEPSAPEEPEERSDYQLSGYLSKGLRNGATLTRDSVNPKELEIKEKSTDLFDQICNLIKASISGEVAVEVIKARILAENCEQKYPIKFLEALHENFEKHLSVQSKAQYSDTYLIDELITIITDTSKDCSQESPINSLSQENQASSSSYNPELEPSAPEEPEEQLAHQPSRLGDQPRNIFRAFTNTLTLTGDVIRERYLSLRLHEERNQPTLNNPECSSQQQTQPSTNLTFSNQVHPMFEPETTNEKKQRIQELKSELKNNKSVIDNYLATSTISRIKFTLQRKELKQNLTNLINASLELRKQLNQRINEKIQDLKESLETSMIILHSCLANNIHEHNDGITDEYMKNHIDKCHKARKELKDFIEKQIQYCMNEINKNKDTLSALTRIRAIAWPEKEFVELLEQDSKEICEEFDYLQKEHSSILTEQASSQQQTQPSTNLTFSNQVHPMFEPGSNNIGF